MFQRIYDSAWQHPGIAWAGALLLVVWIAKVRPQGFMLAFLVGFGLETALDAWCTGALTPLPASVLSSVAIAFVIAGDWRMFALVERAIGGPGAGWVVRSIALAFVVPVLQAVMIKAAPDYFNAEQRRIYLVYEALFLVLGAAWRFLILPGRLERATPEVRRWALGAATWFVLQYALWATSDVLILAGAEWALLLRIVPNTMYYAGFMLFVAWSAPRDARV